MKNDVARTQVLRRAAAGVVIAAVPLLYAVPASALHYNAVWDLYVNNYWGGIALDIGMLIACSLSPLNALACGALAVA